MYFDYRELIQSLADFGMTQAPRILLIAAGCWLGLKLLKLSNNRLLAVMSGRGAAADPVRERRARTLMGIIAGVEKLGALILALLLILPELGINISALVASVGIFGLAVGFGAQSLVKDVVTGFFLLVENQYAIGDVVVIAGVRGSVEDISLRVTVLRDFDGVVHYVPNGQVEVVSNMTKEWSKALLDVGVAYGESVDRVMEVIRQVCDELLEDPVWAPLLLDRIEIPGVQNLGDSSVDIRVVAKVKAGEQWNAMRELRRRLKNRFDEVGIEIPFPQRSVWMRTRETAS